MEPTTAIPGKTASEMRELARAQLDLVLGFFSRAESKMSFLFALDGALLTIIALNLEASDLHVWYLVLSAALSVGLLALSLYHLYLSWSPTLSGGKGSLIYFREIAGRKEAEYIEEFGGRSDDNYLTDLLSQVWRNSVILAEKFSRIDLAFRLTAAALVPWFAFLIGAAITHGKLPVLS